jgi:type VI protein secretion system component Hcp
MKEEEKIYLKLSGVRGDSRHPQHQGEIELWSYNLNMPGISGNQAEKKYSLTVVKKRDRLSEFFNQAGDAGQKFDEAVLTVEKIFEKGKAVHSKIFEFKPVRLGFVTSNVEDDLIILISEELKVIHA